jgi:hypothetical protein
VRGLSRRCTTRSLACDVTPPVWPVRRRSIPFTKHPPEDLPTMDSYYAKDGDKWKLCFPRIYANGCVPRVNQSAVEQMSCS